MTPTEIIIELNNLVTTERVQAAPERLKQAAKEAIPHLRKAVERELVKISGSAEDNSGKPITVKQPCCPRCFDPILNAEQRRINYCPSYGQAIDRTERRGDHAEGKTDQEL